MVRVHEGALTETLAAIVVATRAQEQKPFEMRSGTRLVLTQLTPHDVCSRVPARNRRPVGLVC